MKSLIRDIRSGSDRKTCTLSLSFHHEMIICFTEAKGTYRGIFNRLSAFVTGGKYCHVMVIFEFDFEDEIKYQQCSIVKYEKERINRIQFSDVEDISGWKCYTQKIRNAELEEKIYQEIYAKRSTVFYEGPKMYLEYITCGLYSTHYRGITDATDPNEQTYCSKLTLEILKGIGHYRDQSYDRISPNRLHELISNDSQWCELSQ